jgi:hypothetical protein
MGAAPGSPRPFAFPHGFEQGVEGAVGKHVDFVDDVDLVTALLGGGAPRP